ncbi:MAG: twin-arginine translocation signal domain-containing protein [Bacteroidales bacterium]|nr:twin-arginine translocation signal domain-containing protein [Bacteroidales bacterium]
MVSRRNFIKTSGLAGIAGFPGVYSQAMPTNHKNSKKITVQSVNSNFEREPLIRPFGFKGIYQKEFWVSAGLVESASGIKHVGLMTQCLAWSDLNVFLAHSEAAGNMMLHTTLEHALQQIKGASFITPIELQDAILESTHEYGKKITENNNLRMTFTLSSLVALDNAAWMLYAQENGFKNFDEMIPEEYRSALSYRHKKVAHVPLFSYNVPLSEIEDAVNQGYFFMKIKIGQPGSQEEMLKGDMARIEAIHKLIGDRETPYTQNSKIPYYFDANGRYEKKETLQRFLDHAKKVGMFEQIAVIEEPFPEEADIEVGDLGVRITADESAHTAHDVEKRIQMGYGAIALKAAAKTLSMTLRMAKVAHENNIPCFLADLTCTPILVDWNKNIAARIAPFPGLQDMGLLESNGHQNYVRWKNLVSYHPYPNGSWIKSKDGIFHLDKDFYEKSGGILNDSEHYLELFRNNH